MGRAVLLSLRQMFQPAVLAILLRSLLITLAIFAAVGFAAWHALDWALIRFGLADGSVAGASGIRGAASALVIVIGGWLLWRVIALAVLQFHAEGVVHAVERKYYPERAEHARALPFRREMQVALRAATRAIGFNLLALPFALLLLVTGIGTWLVFLLVNAILLGRELTQMVALRYEEVPNAHAALPGGKRLAMGGLISALMLVPFANFLAPIFGAALATHMVHRSGALTR